MFSVLRLSVWIKVFVVLCYVCSAGIVNGGDEASLPVLETKTKQVIVFKNGLGFFIDEGKTDLKDGWAVIDDVPTATLGSIWLGTLNKGAELTEAVAYKQEVPVETEATTIPNLLMGNLNSNVRVLHK
ncbi:MAG: hypothetical protein GY855_16675, partial [candidate division Zixibacteria bacterium]|nr:hypothetical protein [candidate division Zixibacteria bacterium]